MTTAVTKESLAARIAELESGARSLKEDYTLAAYKMLLATMEAEPVAEITEDLGRLFVKIHFPTTLKAGDELYCHAQPAPAHELVKELLSLRESYAELQERYDLDVNPEGK